MQRRGEHRLGRAGLDQAAEIHDGQAVADMADHRQIVGDDHGGEAELALQVLDQVEHVALHGDVEAGRRLVGEQQMRAHRQRARDADAARLAAGQLVREAVDEGAGQADLRQHGPGGGVAVGNRHALHDERLGEQACRPAGAG